MLKALTGEAQDAEHYGDGKDEVLLYSILHQGMSLRK